MSEVALKPSLDEFRALAREHTVVPVWREVLADLETPVSAFAKLRPLGGAFLFESAEGGERMGRYSFIGVAPRTRLYFRDGETIAERDPENVNFVVPKRPDVVAMTPASSNRSGWLGTAWQEEHPPALNVVRPLARSG